MHSMALRITNSWLNEAGDVIACRYMLKANRQADGYWELQVMVEIAGEWAPAHLPIMPGTLCARGMHVHNSVTDNTITIDFVDHQYQYTIKVERYLVTIQRFNRGDLTHSVWYIPNLIYTSVDIG